MKLELLAPAKNRETGEAAVNHGADAVYIAGERFGAREAAGNKMEDIERLCKYSHKFGAKVYLTLNTILFDSELEQARQMIVRACDAGCDAVIVQDMALLEMDLPPVPLFASTQTDNRLPEKVKFLEDAGFSRVILARELSLEQIVKIRESVSIELESFIHGSLCVSYSGRCYLSQALAGRSANRGICAQLCRLPFDLYNDNGERLVENRQLLSLKDLNLSSQLETLAEIGVNSFKIEGRLKDIAYVKNITAYYRKCLDRIMEKSDKYQKSSSGRVELFFEPEPERSFSRGFTKYFYDGRNSGLNAGTAKSLGKFCGTVISVDKYSFVTDDDSPVNGDGICFFDKSGKLLGTRVNTAVPNPAGKGKLITPLSMEGISTGTKIFRNSDRLFEKKLAGASSVRKICVDVDIAVDDRNIRISAIDEDCIKSETVLPHSGEKAHDSEKIKNIITNQFKKTGNEIFDFNIKNLVCEYFFPLSEINSWRRELSLSLENERLAQYEFKTVNRTPNDVPYITDEIDFTANVSNSLAERFYRRHGVKKIEQSVETGGNPERLMYNKYCIKFELGLCPVKQGAKDCGNLYLVAAGKKLKLHFNCKTCEMEINY